MDTATNNVRIVLALTWAVAVVVGGILWAPLTPVAQAASRENECQVTEVVCWIAADEQLIDARLLPASGFQVINRTTEIVNLAYGWFELGADYQPIGDFRLPVVLPDIWAAKGWFTLKPGTTQVYYPTGIDFYVRIEANGNVIEPTNHMGTTDLCIVMQQFISKEEIGADWFVIDYSDRGDTFGESCATAGGELRTFYKVAIPSTIILE